jgi:hypothetical protein
MCRNPTEAGIRSHPYKLTLEQATVLQVKYPPPPPPKKHCAWKPKHECALFVLHHLS